MKLRSRYSFCLITALTLHKLALPFISVYMKKISSSSFSCFSLLFFIAKHTEGAINKIQFQTHKKLIRSLSLTGKLSSVQFSSVNHSCPTLCDPMDCSTPGFPVRQQLLELTQTHVQGVSNAIKLSHPLSSPSPPAFSLSQHQGLFKCVSSSNQVAKVLGFQLQHQSFQ